MLGGMHPAHPWALPTQPVSRAILLATGVTDGMIRSRLGKGQLVTVRQGVFLAAAAWPSEPGAQHLVRGHAEQVVNPEAVLSHESAAVHWGLPTPGSEAWHEQPVTVTLPVSGHSSRARGAIHRVGPLPAAEVHRDNAGYLVTTPARTAVDLAGGRPLPEALVLLDGAARLICQSMVTSPRRRDYANPRLAGAAAEALAQAAKTVRATRLAPAIALANPSRESVAESLSAGQIELAGLPQPRYQAEIRTSRGVFYPDCFWKEHNLVGECDGAVKYADGSAYVLEKEREQILRDLGYRIVRWLAKEIMATPWLVMERIARALGC